MRIAMDASIQDTPYITGVERVQRSILRELASLDQDNEYWLIAKREIRFDFPLPDNFRIVDLSPKKPSYLWRETLIPPILAREKIDIFHSPVSAIPILGKAKKIATIHELPWVERERQHTKIKHRHRAWLFLNTRYSQRIFAVSQRTKQNILRLYPEAEDRVTVIHHGVDPCFRVLDQKVDAETFLSRFGIPHQPFLFYVGTVRRKKNLKALLSAFAGLPEDLRRRHNLVLAGIRSTSWSDLEEMVRSPELSGKVFFPGYVGDEDLVSFYNLAKVVVYPSYFEGFGLPPLEAMACGAPVLASKGGAIPEVVGKSAALFDPTDSAEMSSVIAHHLEDETARKQLVKRGSQRVKKFRWRTTAETVLNEYRAIMEGDELGA